MHKEKIGTSVHFLSRDLRKGRGEGVRDSVKLEMDFLGFFKFLNNSD